MTEKGRTNWKERAEKAETDRAAMQSVINAQQARINQLNAEIVNLMTALGEARTQQMVPQDG